MTSVPSPRRRSSVKIVVPPPPLDDLVVEESERHALFPEPGLALLAVSGGSDSIALLDILRRVAGRLGLSLRLAHVDHGILPDSADVAEQVMGLACRFEIPGHLASLNLGPDASETTARRARYAALRRIQHDVGAKYLVTAHQAEDQAETVLLRLLRGSGIMGLAGIERVGPDGLVRPLLSFEREDLRRWIDFHFPDEGDRLAVHTDPTNFDVRHDRAWVRHQLLATLKARHGDGVIKELLKVAENARMERRAWAAVLRVLPGLDFQRTTTGFEVAAPVLAGYDKALAIGVLRALSREAGFVLGPRRAAGLYEFLSQRPSGRMMELGEGWVARLEFDTLRVENTTGDDTAGEEPDPIVLEGAGTVDLGAWEVAWRPEPAGILERSGDVTWIPRHGCVLRRARMGERILPLGGAGRRKVAREMMEGRIPASRRAVYPVVALEGNVIWIPGVCRSQEGAVEPGQNALRIEFARRGDT